ncbi:hypothetical protein LR48_Vigan01g062700 [Vigna angularis]|uniref:Uncharacterized protein n=1 Tax=Phaseolus angularis TaxID=3914 RepID=A0A0L9TKW4_PHAAN|nr:hypothetical protein LR48_Vigan01g062700 [Vigna angularis]
MDRIQHKFVKVGDALNLHVAEIGSGENAVVFLYGFERKTNGISEEDGLGLDKCF